jgi:N6-adenosine-specific RNA methylase IME4/ParB-like chromosome segregation protein Spo0J
MTEMAPFHELANALPLLEGEEFQKLVTDVRENGVLLPIVQYEGKILDGRNRLLAAREAGVEIRFIEYKGDDPAAFVISQNVMRRHLNPSQRAMIAGKLAKLRQGQPVKSQICDFTQARAAKLLNVSKRSVEHARDVIEQGAAALVAAVETGKAKVSAAAIIAGEFPVDEQVDIVARGPKELQAAAAALRKNKRAKNRANHMDKVLASVEAPSLPLGRRYPVIYADPPWRYENPHMGSTGRSIEKHYQTMALEHICRLPVRELATPDAVLFLWCTVPHTYCSAPKVLDAWGFEFRSEMVWDKVIIGTGYWTRGQHEKLLICTRGKIDSPHGSNCPPSLYREKRGLHSAKHAFFYDVIEKMFPEFCTRPPAPPLMIELFANVKPEDAREGWAVWGKPHRVRAKEVVA